VRAAVPGSAFIRDSGDGDGEFMEPQRSQPVATGGQMREPRKRLEQAKTVATDCDQLPIGAHGEEGVDGSSPSEGFSGEAIPGDKFCCLL
jgi:hypothetical protein